MSLARIATLCREIGPDLVEEWTVDTTIREIVALSTASQNRVRRWKEEGLSEDEAWPSSLPEAIVSSLSAANDLGDLEGMLSGWALTPLRIEGHAQAYPASWRWLDAWSLARTQTRWVIAVVQRASGETHPPISIGALRALFRQPR